MFAILAKPSWAWQETMNEIDLEIMRPPACTPTPHLTPATILPFICTRLRWQWRIACLLIVHYWHMLIQWAVINAGYWSVCLFLVLRQCRNKRVRTIFTPDQLEQLEKIFEKQQYMVGTERYYLASKLQLSEAQVKVWFQNRRIKWRKQSGLDGSRSTDIDESTSRDRRGDFSDSCSESGLSETGSLWGHIHIQ